jgi:hypothetical protein
MTGINQWNQNVEVQANPGKRITSYQEYFSDVILAGGTHELEVFSPPGYISRIVNMVLTYPVFVGGTTGTKGIVCSVFTGNITVTYASCPYNIQLDFQAGQWNGATSQTPEDDILVLKLIQGTQFDEDNGFKITFSNSTDASDGGILKGMDLVVIEEKIGA